MMKFVRAHKVANRAQTIHLDAQSRRQLDRRPYPQIAVRQSGDDGTRRVGSTKEADDLAFRDPKSLIHLLQHIFTLCRERLPSRMANRSRNSAAHTFPRPRPGSRVGPSAQIVTTVS